MTTRRSILFSYILALMFGVNAFLCFCLSVETDDKEKKNHYTEELNTYLILAFVVGNQGRLEEIHRKLDI